MNFYRKHIALWTLSFVVAVSLFVFERAASADATDEVDVFEEIERMHLEGEISDAQRTIYRVAAIRAPHMLPECLRDREVRGRGPAASKSFVMFQAFQELHRMDQADRDVLQPLLNPPSGYAHYVEMAEPFPMRVFYNNEPEEPKAQAMLTAAAHCYEVEIEDWGFWEPPIDPAYGYYPAYVDDTGSGGGAYTAPYAENPATPHSDAFSYIVMDSLNSVSSIPVIWAHEYNHACQCSADMWERWAFYEATATYIMSQVYPSDWYYTESFIPSFQNYPHKALDWQDYGGAGMGYVYGASLWVIFLEQMYGGDDPSWIADVWEGCVQNNGMTNEPDYFDAVDDAIASEGGFEAMFPTFAQYRYFVGGDSDGQHLAGSAAWNGCEVDKERTHTSTDLPVVDQGPSGTTKPEQNGCNYVELSITQEVQTDLDISFSGQASMDWNVDVMTIPEDGVLQVETMDLPDGAEGELEISAMEGDLVVMVICHLADWNYDPDQENWIGGSYTYSIDGQAAPGTAKIEFVSPATVTQGDGDVAMTITGQGFVDHADLGVEVVGGGVLLTDVVFVSSSTIMCTAAVDADAAIGERDVTVSLPDDDPVTGEGLLTILEAEAPQDEVPDTSGGDGGGCGCSSVGVASGGVFSLLRAMLSIF